MTSKLEALKAAFASKASSGSNNQDWTKFYPFWKMADDTTAIFRFLPDLDEENPMGFLVEELVHELYINGEKKTVACGEMYGKKCPICDLSRQYYSANDEANGKKYYRKKSYIGQGIVVDSPIEHDTDQLVKLISIGPKIFKLIQAAFQSGDLEMEPYALKGGYNFRIKKSKNGQYSNYDISTFAPKQSDIEDDIIEKIELYDLKSYRKPEVSFDELEKLLEASLNGTPTETPTQASVPSSSAETVQTTSTSDEVKEETAPATSSGSGSSALAALRARAKAKAAEAEE